MKHCPTCGKKVVLNETFDAYACYSCDTWLEDACTDPECEFCRDRPDRSVTSLKHRKNRCFFYCPKERFSAT